MGPVMTPELRAELVALHERWRKRAAQFSKEAHAPTCRQTDVIRLTAMASTLEWAATDLSIYTSSSNCSS
jgi:hypothetical protein